MELRNGRFKLSVHVYCRGADREPFILRREQLTSEEREAMPTPTGSLMKRCDEVINLNEDIDHLASSILRAEHTGTQRLLVMGLDKWLFDHLSRSNFSLADIAAGKKCGINFDTMRNEVLKHATRNIVEENMEDFFNLFEHQAPILQTCCCVGPPNNRCMMKIGENFETECYNCYANGFEGRNWMSRRSFYCYTRNIVMALVMEGEAFYKRNHRKNSTLDEMCDMAECLSQELKRLMLEAPFHFFLYAARAAFNRMIGRDQNDTRIWTTIINPRDELLVADGSDDGSELLAGEVDENDGTVSGDATVPYPMPMDEDDGTISDDATTVTHPLPSDHEDTHQNNQGVITDDDSDGEGEYADTA